jgi:hypothetical protein
MHWQDLSEDLSTQNEVLLLVIKVPRLEETFQSVAKV